MKKKLIILLLGGILLGGNILKVNAEDKIIKEQTTDWNPITIDGSQIYKNYYTSSDKKNIKNYTFGINLIESNELLAFCIENGKIIINNGGKAQNNIYDLHYDTLDNFISTDKKIKLGDIEYKSIDIISLIAYYGNELYNIYNNNNEKEANNYYIAAQKLIWEKISETEGIYIDYSNIEKEDGKYYKKIKLNDKDEYRQKFGEKFYGNIILSTISGDINNEHDVSKYENEIIKKVIKYFEIPEILNDIEIEDFEIDEETDDLYYDFDEGLNDFTFSSKSECKIQDKKIICSDKNDDDKINMEIIKGNEGYNNYYVISDGNEDINQKFIRMDKGYKLPYTTLNRSFDLEDLNNTMVTEPSEPDEENPETSDTNIILIITICCCALISAIIIYIKKINLIKNNTI